MSIDVSKLSAFLSRQRWFAGKASPISAINVIDSFPLGLQDGSPEVTLAIIEVTYQIGSADRYFTVLESDAAGELTDALARPAVARSLLRLITTAATLPAESGGLRGELLPNAQTLNTLAAQPSPRPISGEQSNSSIIFDDKVILKVLRKLEPGLNPEVEIGQFLAALSEFHAAPRLLGMLQLQSTGATVALLHEFVPHAIDGWNHILESFRRSTHLEPTLGEEIAALGTLVGQTHAALASRPDDVAFAPEPVQLEDLQRWSSSIIGELGVTLAAASSLFPRIFERRDAVVQRARKLAHLTPSGQKIRLHGDLHLGQVLRTEDGWRIFDFEGEPGRKFAQRREKQSPLKDVAAMLRSFSYVEATATQLAGRGPTGQAAEARSAFVSAYVRSTENTGLLPKNPADFAGMLDAFELDKLLYEVRYELNNRPDWVHIPLDALMQSEESS